jgi:hypothetical protein
MENMPPHAVEVPTVDVMDRTIFVVRAQRIVQIVEDMLAQSLLRIRTAAKPQST